MIADLTGPRPHYLVLADMAFRQPGAIREEGACLRFARGYLLLIGRRTPLSSTRRRG